MVFESRPVRELDGWHLNYAVARYVCIYNVRTAFHLPNKFYVEEDDFKVVEVVVDGEKRLERVPCVKRLDFLPVQHKIYSEPVITKLRLVAVKCDEGWSCEVDGFEKLFKHFHKDIALLRAAVALCTKSETVEIPIDSRFK
ncbi:hypothetical protein [Pseudomonas sp. TWR3-1-1]|uniref:hypothetical protein n=1 Tax=Pseudomonas sp. TWR3-1-1 TaxID=2804633 RepID=UPI003CF88778